MMLVNSSILVCGSYANEALTYAIVYLTCPFVSPYSEGMANDEQKVPSVKYVQITCFCGTMDFVEFCMWSFVKLSALPLNEWHKLYGLAKKKKKLGSMWEGLDWCVLIILIVPNSDVIFFLRLTWVASHEYSLYQSFVCLLVWFSLRWLCKIPRCSVVGVEPHSQSDHWTRKVPERKQETENT